MMPGDNLVKLDLLASMPKEQIKIRDLSNLQNKREKKSRRRHNLVTNRPHLVGSNGRYHPFMASAQFSNRFQV